MTFNRCISYKIQREEVYRGGHFYLAQFPNFQPFRVLIVRDLVLSLEMMSLYRGIVFLAPFLLLLSGLVYADPVLDLQNKGRPAWDAQLAKSKTCTAANLKVRKEW